MIGLLLEKVVPRRLWTYRIGRWKISTGESEQVLLPMLCDRGRSTVDVGAANGAFTAHCLLYSKNVLAFEPRPAAVAALRQMFHTRLVEIFDVALSDKDEQQTLRIPIRSGMLATIEQGNDLGGLAIADHVSVVARRLDSYRFDSVGFLKIDVEGHEEAVLAGAIETIKRDRPRVMVEVEERHRAGSVFRIWEWFRSIDYEGFFFLDGKLHPLAEVVVDVHQNPANLVNGGVRSGLYINNFLFFPRESSVGARSVSK